MKGNRKLENHGEIPKEKSSDWLRSQRRGHAIVALARELCTLVPKLVTRAICAYSMCESRALVILEEVCTFPLIASVMALSSHPVTLSDLDECCNAAYL